MRIKYLFLIIILYTIVPNVFASTITYNLNIDDTMKFNETIVYEVEESKVLKDGSTNAVTDAVNNTVYFDIDKEIPYTKEKSNVSSGYKVILKHDYASMFLPKSRILAECFKNVTYNRDIETISFTAPSPFYCSHRADKIIVNITTNLNVTKTNANLKNNNTYTWNEINENFSIEFNLDNAVPQSKELDDISDENTENTKETDGVIPTTNTNRSLYIILTTIGVLLLLSLLGFLILKHKKENMDKI